MIGTTLAASSEVHPMTSARLEVVANICLVAGTASAGSPLVSTPLQLSLWPSTPPALLMAAVAPSQDTRYVGPSAASGPLNGARSATTSVEPEALAPVLALLLLLLLLELLLHAARPAAASRAAASAAARLAGPSLMPDARNPGLSGPCVLRVVNMIVPSRGERFARVRPTSGYGESLGYRPPGEAFGRHRHPERSPSSATTRLRMVPIPSIVISITSPG